MLETRERPILFSGPLVRAILAGKKTQTRRLVTQRTSELGSGVWSRLDFSDAFVDPGGTPIFGPGPYLKVASPSDETRHRVYPRIQKGDRLYVRETWGLLDTEPSDGPERATVFYRATDGVRHQRWRPSIHMPRWASRITLEVTDVRLERLQAITTEDIDAEGLRIDYSVPAPPYELQHEQRQAFRDLWDGINGGRPGASWEANPFVWVVCFRGAKAGRKVA